jgi:anti-anti-sigma regulatory factor
MSNGIPRVLDDARDLSSVLGQSRAHAKLDRPTVSALCLSVSGSGGDHDALVFRSRIENLVRCGLPQLVIDAHQLDDAGSTFIRVLADAITSARARGCMVSIVGLDSVGILEALYRAPLSQLVTIYGSRHPRGRRGRPSVPVDG